MLQAGPEEQLIPHLCKATSPEHLSLGSPLGLLCQARQVCILCCMYERYSLQLELLQVVAGSLCCLVIVCAA